MKANATWSSSNLKENPIKTISGHAKYSPPVAKKQKPLSTVSSCNHLKTMKLADNIPEDSAIIRDNKDTQSTTAQSGTILREATKSEKLLSSWDLKKVPVTISSSGEAKYQFGMPLTRKEQESSSKLKRSRSGESKLEELLSSWDLKKVPATVVPSGEVKYQFGMPLSRKEQKNDLALFKRSRSDVSPLLSYWDRKKSRRKHTLTRRKYDIGSTSSTYSCPPMKANAMWSSWDLKKVPIKNLSGHIKYKLCLPLKKKQRPSLAISKDLKSKPNAFADPLSSYWDLKKEPAITTPSSGEIVYKACPSLTEKQQCIMEYSLPLVLPGIFYVQTLSNFGLYCCFAIVAVHTLETSITDFGKSATGLCAYAGISPLVHYFMDCVLLHSIISAMLLAPHYFVGDTNNSDDNIQVVIHTAILLIQTLPIYLSVCFKSNYFNYQQQQDKNRSTGNVGLLIVNCFVW
eukprot:CAMPEP_0194206116 /NCGR_PEP_ID=MMETSP0156-20130528/5219_1 /TAXON_ID=33649 /ORGANISM="Thalassionema nitzschioides, Strain L26-B" /LENGTH=458 /DNA_ID=CAMNT_0038932547 /DNA_START=116 /DNA_END=1489 /DNA_ORIENTATION=+